MIKKIRTNLNVLLCIVSFILASTFQNHFLYGAMFGNESCLAFDPNGTTQTTNKSGLAIILSEDPCETLGNTTSGMMTVDNDSFHTLGFLIANGGGQFLKSAGYFNLFISEYELSEISGLNLEALDCHLENAIDNMTRAYSTYYRLKKLAASTPYNQTVINWLIEFDYYGFQKKFVLIPSIVDKVQFYLSSGDVRGVYREFHDQTGQILDLLYNLKKDIDSGNLPNLSNVWRLNQKFSELKIFSQYVAEVFFKLKE